MTVRRGPYSIKSSHHLYVASVLEEWKRDARDGKVLGVVLGGLDENMMPVVEVAGILYHRPRDAHWVASVLVDDLLKRSLK